VRVRLAIIVLLALVTEGHAQEPAGPVRGHADVWERVLARLESLPRRWDRLPAPAVPPSGRRQEQALDAASAVELEAAAALFERLRLAPPEAQERVLAEVRARRTLTEADLWWPARLVREQQTRSIDEAGLALDAWLALGEDLGRRDVLLRAAGYALQLASLRVPRGRLVPVARQWSALPPGPHGSQGAATVKLAQARLLMPANLDEALDACHAARQLYGDAGDAVGQGHTWLVEALIRNKREQDQEALHAARRARSLYVDLGEQLGQGYTWFVEAKVLDRLGQDQAALAAYRHARARHEAAGDKLGQGNTWLGEADVLYEHGQNQVALHGYRQARALYMEVADKLGQGNTWRGEADVLYRLGQNQEAAQSYRLARSAYAEVGDNHGQGNTWFGEAQVLYRLGQNQEALEAYRRARSLHATAGDRQGQGYASYSEAEVLYRLGRNREAMEAYRRARSLYGKLNLGYTWLGTAEVLHRLGRNQEALRACRLARTHYAAMSHKEGQGYAWFGEATIMHLLGHGQEALAAHRRARSLFADIDDKQGEGFTWRGEAQVLQGLGKAREALDAFRRARALFADAGHRQGEGFTWSGEAEVLLQRRELGPALRAARNAIHLASQVEAIGDELYARTLEARILLALGQESHAVQCAGDALALLRRWRGQGVMELDRTAMANWSQPHDILIPILARRRGPAVEDALALAEEAHAPVLLDLLVSGSRRIEDTSDPSLLEGRERLQRERAELDRKLLEAMEPDRREELLHERDALDVQLESDELMAMATLRSPIVSGTPLRGAALQALVDAVGPILLYYVARTETVAFLLLPGQRAPVVRRIALARDRLGEDVRALRHDASNPLWEARALARRRALFARLVAPFHGALAGARRLTIIPHGPLHELPFEALLDAAGAPLFERWHVAIAPSLSALHTLHTRRVQRQQPARDISFLGIAGGAGLSLPYREVADVGTWFGDTARIVTQQADTRRAYAELAPHARHILISSHGKHVARSRSGYLELGAADGVAARLTAGDIAQLPLRAELVTLAACETARGEAMLSDERLDLARAFLIAGADAVLATRWRVPEHPSTRQFLLDFYQALHRGGPGGTAMRKDEALTEARRRSRARGDHAQLWAAWVLVGDAR
jgi:CHAT domain-containing protein